MGHSESHSIVRMSSTISFGVSHKLAGLALARGKLHPELLGNL